METKLLSIFADSEASKTALAFLAAVLILGYLAWKGTGGFMVRYTRAGMSRHLQDTLVFLHIFCTVIPALILPNNYLSHTDYFSNLYAENEVWIAVTGMVLMLFNFIVTGTVFTLLTEFLWARREEDR